MASWLEGARPDAGRSTGGSDGLCIGRSELLRFEASTERVLEARRARTHKREDAACSIVLAACHRDRDLLRPALHFLANQGVPVYVDFREGGVPDEGSGEYASWLRQCLERDRRFVLVSTQEGLTSPWAPWQLGLAEGTLGLENVAILPVEDYGYFRGSLLSGLYPGIRSRNDRWMVMGPRGRVGSALEDWLST